jgi:ABC-type sugar transport system ATPase subunit
MDWKGTYAKAAEILEALRLELPVTAKVSSLSAGQRQMVEIAKAMSYDPSVLILDEATSRLTPFEAESLFRVVRRYRDQGRIVLFITHQRNAIRAVADQVTVIRDGRCAGSLPAAEAEPGTLVDLMFGDTPVLSGQDRPPAAGEEVLAVQGLTRNERFTDVSFSLHKGEILGLAGRLGSGRSQLLRSIFGLDPLDAGTILLQGRAITRPQIPDMMRLGLALAPGNRKEEGPVQSRSIADTFSLASLSAMVSLGGGNDQRQTPVVLPWLQELRIKLAHAGLPVASRSGGSTQQRLAGDWLDSEPSILFIDEPSHGLDLQARQQLFRILWDLSRQGLSVVLVSTELKELMEVCHRILVMDRGRIAVATTPGQTSLDQLYALCLEGAVPAPSLARQP